MTARRRHNLLGVLIDAVNYESATEQVLEAAKAGRPLGAAALAVHGVMTGVKDAEQRYRLNHLDMVTPDGQPVRWGLNLLHGTGLVERVYGPTLTIRVLRAAADERLPVFFYGSRAPVLQSLVANVTMRFPGLLVAGAEPSRFRSLTIDERDSLINRIKGSGARITLVGLGCPRQEVFVYECCEALSMPVLAVGAAFDYHAGLLSEPSPFLQRAGLHWVVRLLQDPRRLWRRYLLLNPVYLALLAAQALGVWHPDTCGGEPARELRYG